MTIVEVGHLVEITTEFQSVDEDGSNVYFYVNVGVGAGLDEIMDGFVTTFASLLSQGLHADNEYTAARGRDIFVEGSSISTDMAITGSATGGGDPMPFFNAVPITINHDEEGVGAGSKRYGGIGEVWSDNGRTYNSLGQANILPLLGMLESAFASIGAIATLMEPVVVGRVGNPVDGYRLPETEVEALATGFGLVDGVVTKDLGHQTSRRD